MTTVDIYNVKFAPGNTLPSGEQHLGAVGSTMVRADVEFIRPNDATAYAANDIVSNNVTTTTLFTLTNCARINGGSGYIVKIRVSTDKKSITPRFRLHLFNVNTPTVAADNASHKAVYADIGKRIGSYDLAALSTPADTANSDISSVVDLTVRLPFICAANDRNIYGFLETLDAFTPAANEKFTISVVCDQN